MRIEKVSMPFYAARSASGGRSSVREKSYASEKRTDKLTNLGAASFGIAFKSRMQVYELDENTARQEKKIMDEMRTAGVSTPVVRSDNTYMIKGKKAHPKENPITKEHIKNVLNNIFIMDRAGLAHGDIEEGHVFYSDNGGIELDCFKYNWNFDNKGMKQREFPDFYYPSNIKQFEGNSIGAYISRMDLSDDENKPQVFIKNYLKEASKFHADRAAYLELNDLGALEQIEYEQLKSEVYANPDDDVSKLFEDKVRIQFETRTAFTEWDEGRGACGNKVNDNRTAEGIKMYLTSINDNAEYIKKIKTAKEKSSGVKRKYLDYEEKLAKHMLNVTKGDVCGMAPWTLNPKNPANLFKRNIPSADKMQLDKKLKKLGSMPADDGRIGAEALKVRNFYSKRFA